MPIWQKQHRPKLTQPGDTRILLYNFLAFEGMKIRAVDPKSNLGCSCRHLSPNDKIPSSLQVLDPSSASAWNRPDPLPCAYSTNLLYMMEIAAMTSPYRYQIFAL